MVLGVGTSVSPDSNLFTDSRIPKVSKNGSSKFEKASMLDLSTSVLYDVS